MQTRRERVAVLGLGRMGAAMAVRLAAEGWPVTGWTRSGRVVPGVPVADAMTAVSDAEVVLLCVYDGPACSAVLDLVADHLPAGSVVVNTATVAPGEAEELADRVRAAGAHYVQAPVMGSVPAVAQGTLQILLGGDPPAAAERLLAALGTPLQAGGVADAARAKLLANGVLAQVVLTLRESARHADELGLDPELAWSVLERTALGRLVAGKRTRLATSSYGDAEFTVGALAKDVALLAAESPRAKPLADQLADALANGVPPDADIAALVDADPRVTPASRASGPLEVAPGMAADPAVLVPLADYARGHATGDPAHFRRAFLPTAHVEGLREGVFVSWPLADYCALFDGRPAADEPTRRRRLDRLQVEGSVATAVMTLWHGADVFTDVFLLVRVDGGWRIANKAYHRG